MSFDTACPPTFKKYDAGGIAVTNKSLSQTLFRCYYLSMAFKSDENLLKMVWKNLPKSPDKEHVTFTREDIEEVWLTGFVDTNKYSVEEWVKAFEPHKVEENKYILKKEDFLEKDKYRYSGEIMIPFNPLHINEGKYTDEGLQELIDQSISPSCILPPDQLNKLFERFKKRYRTEDNLIIMNMDGKLEIADLLLKYPSPRRQRELLFDAIFTKEMNELTGVKGPPKASPEQAAKIQASTFSTLPSNIAEKASKELDAIEKKAEREAGTSEESDIELKDIKKSRKGPRG